MPTQYKRKGTARRAQWTEEQIIMAANEVRNGTMGIREACRNFSVPPPTLRRRLKCNDFSKKTLGPPSILGVENEKKLKTHIQKLQKHGFAPTRRCVRSMAFHLAEQLKIKHKFNKQKEMAGEDWLILFLRRHPDLSVRKAEGVSLARCQGMSRTEVSSYFTLLEATMNEAGLINKPGNIFNMDETGLQLNNKPGYVIAKKGSKNVAAITSSEKGETITLISCCNAEGVYIPPACIFKGKNKKSEFEDGMPPGSVVYMSQKSAYINTDLMFTWLKNHFIPRKPPGKVILILDGHASHCNSPGMLEYAEEHDVILLCLPSHTTQFLQPLDRAFFKSLKLHFNNACNGYIRANPTRKISRLQFGQLLSQAWSKAATVENAVSAFRATGICPFNPEAIPDYAYLEAEETNKEPAHEVNDIETIEIIVGMEPEDAPAIVAVPTAIIDKDANTSSQTTEQTQSSPPAGQTTSNSDTPGSMLNKIHPIPSTSSAVDKTEKVRSRAKQVAQILTSPEHIQERVLKLQQKTKKIDKKTESSKRKLLQPKKATVKGKKKKALSESSTDESDLELQDSEDSFSEEDQTECLGCGERYNETVKKDDWIKCIHCQNWFHENCSKYVNLCDLCGKVLAQKKN